MKLILKQSQKIKNLDYSEGHILCAKKIGHSNFMRGAFQLHSIHRNFNIRFVRLVFEKNEQYSVQTFPSQTFSKAVTQRFLEFVKFLGSFSKRLEEIFYTFAILVFIK